MAKPEPTPSPMASLDSYVQGLRARAAERVRAEGELRDARRERLRAVVDALVREFHVTRVVLFGSLARGDARASSDVDLLVEGLAKDRFIEACALADRLMGDAYVDLVPVELARPEIRARAEAEGEVLHGRA